MERDYDEDYMHMLNTLSNVQARCTELLMHNRDLKSENRQLREVVEKLIRKG